MMRFIDIASNYKKLFQESRKGIEDVIISMMPQVVALLTTIITTTLIARGLGPAGVGKYALVLSIPALVSALSELGIGQTAIRFASLAASKRDTETQHAVLRWAFRLRMFFSFFIIIIIFVMAPSIASMLWHDESLTFLLRLSLLLSVFSVLAQMPAIYFVSLKRFRMNTIISTGQILLTFFGILIVAYLKAWYILWVLVVNLISTGLGALAFIIFVPKSAFIRCGASGLHPSNHPFYQRLKQFFESPTKIKFGDESLCNSNVNNFAFFMALSSILVMLTLQADIWLMGYFLEKGQIGIYNVAKYYSLPLDMAVSAINTAILPRVSSLTSSEKIVELMKTTFKFSLFAAVGILIYAIIAPMTIPLIFGEPYRNGILLGQILCTRYCISVFANPMGVIGCSLGAVKHYWWISATQLILVIIINIVLLPAVGALGSALALISIEIAGAMLLGMIIWRKIHV